MRIEQIVETGVLALDYELVAVEYVPQRGGSLLRVFIDSPDGITLDDCEKVSRQVSALLDVEDPIKGQYRLEVSSPGIDRPLVTPEHFERFCGEKVKVTTHGHYLGRKRFTGLLTGVSSDGIVVDVDGEAYDLPFDDINTARLAPDWSKQV